MSPRNRTPSFARIIRTFSALAGLLGLAVARLEAADFPRQTVVILNGLAGDVESERADEAILEGLLSGLNPSSQKRVLVLSDAKVVAPTGLSCERRDPTRANFLALAEELKGGPVTVFVWGHGGLIGDKPVFHVRGPRLSPADFSKAAEVFGEEWVLMFCGSGSFAQALIGQNRSVLASEAETRFSSDPIGMRFVTGTLREAAGLDGLARTMGQKVLGYYTERKLARNEEPSLWTGGAVQKVATNQETPPPAKEPSEGADPGAWSRLTRVRPEDYPEADGVILWRSQRYVLGDSTAIRQEHEEVIQILGVEGKRLGDFNLTYSPPGESIEIEVCEVLGPDGKLEKVSADSIHEAGWEDGGGEYARPVRKSFSLPGVVPGALLHVRCSQSWKHFPMPQVSLAISAADSIPIISSELEVRVSNRSPFHFAWRGMTGPDPEIETQNRSQIYRWKLNSVATFHAEPLEPDANDPALLVSTWADWTAFSEWYRHLTKLADAVTPEIEAKARELTAGKTTELEKAEAIYTFVTRLRYVAVELGVNSHRPHAAANVFRNGYGDCKDKANLFNTLLHAIGMEADLVLVPRFSQASASVPGLAFNHAISRFKADGTVRWADTTDDVCRFGLLPPGDSQRNVLVIHPTKNALEPLPGSPVEANGLKIEQFIDLRTARGVARVSAVATGFFDYQGRTGARAVATQRKSSPVWKSWGEVRVGEFRLNNQQNTEIAALERTFEWNAAGTYTDLLTPLPQQNGSILQVPMLFPRDWSEVGQKRTRPLYLNHGYPGHIEQRIELQLPGTEGQTVVLPEPVGREDGPLRWRVEWKQAGRDRLEVSVRIEWPKAELTLPETAVFQTEWSRLRAAALMPAVLRK